LYQGKSPVCTTIWEICAVHFFPNIKQTNPGFLEPDLYWDSLIFLLVHFFPTILSMSKFPFLWFGFLVKSSSRKKKVIESIQIFKVEGLQIESKGRLCR